MARVMPVVDSYPLRGLLYCACGQRFFPWGWTERTRTYLSLCGCRLQPIDASAIEQRVRAKAGLAATAPASDRDEADAVALGRLFSRISLGGTAEDLRLLRHP